MHLAAAGAPQAAPQRPSPHWLGKGHPSVACHFCRWGVAPKPITTAWIPSGEDRADALAKLLPEAAVGCLPGSWVSGWDNK